MLQTTVKDTTKTEYIAIYCRTATYDCVSIENQKARLIQAAFDRGYAIEQILVFADNGYPGTTLNRPDMKRLLVTISELPVKEILTVDGSRIARAFELTMSFLEKTQTIGTKVFELQGDYLHELALPIEEQGAAMQAVFQILSDYEKQEAKPTRRIQRAFQNLSATLFKGGDR